MGGLYQAILKHRRWVLICACAFIALCGVGMTQVRVNYDLADYLPKDAPSTVALDALYATSGGGVPNMQVMLPDVSVQGALAAKEALRGLSGVQSVLWLDDTADLKTPVNAMDPALTGAWYKDGAAMLLLTVAKEAAVDVRIRVLSLYPDAVLAGEAVNQAVIQSMNMGEVAQVMIFAVPLVLLILLISTRSWLEPVLFLAVIGGAIVMNEGTNLLLGGVSFVTQACSAILQLAVSIDYAVFLLHRFDDERETGLAPKEAMLRAMKGSGRAVAASALTTVLGFATLMLMRFELGKDMGLVLAKGILLSYLSVMVILPALAVGMSKALDKTRHRPLLPRFWRLGRFVARFAAPLAVALFITLPVSYLAQGQNAFAYGSSGMFSSDSAVRRDADVIAERFGSQQQLLLLVPVGRPAAEAQLAEALAQTPHVLSVTSYATAAGVQVPDVLVPAEQLGQLRSGGYSRIILYADTPDEGAEAFALVESVRGLAVELYGADAHLVGQCAVNYDLKNVITEDTLKVQLGAVLGIFIVLLFTFRGAVLPLLLLIVIEGAVWFNLGLPYFMGETLNYIGYQIISSVQLGATVDYGILMGQEYIANRKTMEKKEALAVTVGYATRSILPSALILIAAGTLLGLMSTNGVISQLGAIFGRGAAISTVMVVFLLPMLLLLFDKVILKSTWGKKEAIK